MALKDGVLHEHLGVYIGCTTLGGTQSYDTAVVVPEIDKSSTNYDN